MFDLIRKFLSFDVKKIQLRHTLEPFESWVLYQVEGDKRIWYKLDAKGILWTQTVISISNSSVQFLANIIFNCKDRTKWDPLLKECQILDNASPDTNLIFLAYMPLSPFLWLAISLKRNSNILKIQKLGHEPSYFDKSKYTLTQPNAPFFNRMPTLPIQTFQTIHGSTAYAAVFNQVSS